MNNVKTREEIVALRQKELVARNNYYAAFTEYIDALDTSKKSKTIACGDDRFLIIKDVVKVFDENSKISFPDEVKKETFLENADEYQHLAGIVAFGVKIKSKSSGKKVPFGKKLANDFQTVHDHVTLKADKNEDYVDVAKATAVYHDPKGKRKDNKLAKKRSDKASKKQPPSV
jgi:hypothetical protein